MDFIKGSIRFLFLIYSFLNVMRTIILAICVCLNAYAMGQTQGFEQEDIRYAVEKGVKDRALQKLFPVSNDNELNKLLGRYRNGDSIIISNRNGRFKAGIHIDNNFKSGKPFGISFSGWVSSETSMMSFIDSISTNRRKHGYFSERSSFSVEEELKRSDLQRGIVYIRFPFATVIVIDQIANYDRNDKLISKEHLFHIYDFDYYRSNVDTP